MTDYKLVPVELLKDWHERINTIAAETAFNVADEMESMLYASPAVQGGAVGWYTEDHLDDKSATTYKAEVAQRWRDKGWPVWPLYTAPQPAEQHPDDAAVDRFAAAMKAKLAKKRTEGRSGWQDATAAHLSHLLHEHVRKGDPVDVGNLAMMLHQNEQGIEQKPVPDVAGLVDALEKIAAFQPKDILCGSGWKEWNRAGEYAASIARDALAAWRGNDGEKEGANGGLR